VRATLVHGLCWTREGGVGGWEGMGGGWKEGRRSLPPGQMDRRKEEGAGREGMRSFEVQAAMS